MTASTDDLLLRLAREKRLVRDDQIAAARLVVAQNLDLPGPAPRVLDVLIAQGALDRRQIAALLANEFGLRCVELSSIGPIPAEVLARVPRALVVRHQLIPLACESRTLQVVVSDPLDTDAIDLLSHQLNLTIDVAMAAADEISAAIDRLYPTADGISASPLSAPDTIAISSARRGASSVGGAGAKSDHDADAPIIQLVHAVLARAIECRASDIHWEPLEKRFRVRYRVDGVLFEVEEPPKRLQLAIVSRLKIMANISIAEKRVPQDGRIEMTLEGRSLDLRVSSLPTAHGESVVMRILDRDGLQLGLAELGFAREDQACLERLIARPDGLMLVTGPTGSGKTTTLYGCLHYINHPDRKIITVEDPVEYQLAGINQVPVRTEVGVTFASALRAILRQAPNIVMIGEIRDLETAEIAIQAALTGHLVFSTLHTNDAPGAVTRLIDLGVKPFLVSSALRASMAQRLVRKNCESCRQPYAPPESEVRALRLDSAKMDRAEFRRGAGCAACRHTGYRGRTGIFELFVVDDELQRMIYENAGSARLREKARGRGMRTMREDGVRKVIAGLTTLEEVVSITASDPR